MRCSSWKLLFAVSLAVAMSGVANADMITQNFDTDPGWSGNDNTGYGTNNFGYSNTNNAGGTSGEAGGSIMYRTQDTWAWYLGSLGDTLDATHSISATGRFIMTGNLSTADGGFELGFFNSNNLTQAQNWGVDAGGGTGGVAESIALRFADDSGVAGTYRIHLRMGNYGAKTKSGSSVYHYAVGTPYLFDLEYVPDGTGNVFTSLTISDTSNNVVASRSFTVSEPTGWSLDSFGIMTNNFSYAEPAAGGFYFDNLQYTSAVPEPGCVTLMTTALFGLLAYGWRKRR